MSWTIEIVGTEKILCFWYHADGNLLRREVAVLCDWNGKTDMLADEKRLLVALNHDPELTPSDTSAASTKLLLKLVAAAHYSGLDIWEAQERITIKNMMDLFGARTRGETAEPANSNSETAGVCKECRGTGAIDSGGLTPWDAPISIKCGCQVLQQENITLLPCPFCGSADVKLDHLTDLNDYFISCQDCEIQQIANYLPDVAVERWNRRS